MPSVEAAFGFAEMQVVSFADLYAGKIVAALDRQHPRDLFDVRNLLANEGIGDELRAAFIVYLLSHTRPMSEVLAARPKDIAREFAQNFQGMTTEPVELNDLLAARSMLVQTMIGRMPDTHRQFLVGFEKGQPEWPLLGLTRIDKLPAVQWRRQNLETLSEAKRSGLIAQLENVLGLSDSSRVSNSQADPGSPKPVRPKKS